jgi:hypothetical protein
VICGVSLIIVSSLQSVDGCAAMVAAAIPDAMLVPTDVSVVQEAQLPVHDGLACPKHALSNSNPGSWLVMKETSRLHFEGRRLLPLNESVD